MRRAGPVAFAPEFLGEERTQHGCLADEDGDEVFAAGPDGGGLAVAELQGWCQCSTG